MADEPRAPRRPLELLDQPRLADPSLAPDVDRLAVSHLLASREQCPEPLEFAVAADERPVPRFGGLAQPQQTPGPHWLGEPLDRQRPGLGARQPLGQRPVNGVRDQDFARLRRVGKPRSKIHRLAGDCVLAVPRAARPARDHWAAGNSDVHPERAAARVGERGHLALDLERGAGGAFGVVAVRHGGAEDGHDAIADVLADRTAVALDYRVDDVEEAAGEGVQLLRVDLATELGIAREVGE